MGGIASTNAQGPYRAMGSIRDWIIGITVVDIAGRLSKSGGRVVKNVTGYDLAKLYTGSLGSLAIIVEISLKLRAAFGKTATAITRCGDIDTASDMWSRIRQSPLQPVAAEWVGPEHAAWLRFGDNARAVDWQLKNLPTADWQILEGPEEVNAWDELAFRYKDMGPGMLKVLTKPSQIGKVIQEHNPEAWMAHAMNGIVLMAAGNVEQIREVRQHYSVVIERAPLEWRRQMQTFQLQGTEYDLMLKMKNAFDPEGRLNPGRHVDGERN
jgi:glycolate oxidase FAD binding subunit